MENFTKLQFNFYSAFFAILFSFLFSSTGLAQELVDSNPWSDVQEQIDTARHNPNLTPREKDMIREINMVRTDPKRYLSIVEEHLNNSKIPSSRWNNPAEISAIESLMHRLKTMTPVKALQPLDCLYKTALTHGKECLKNNKISHLSISGKRPDQRMKTFCKNTYASVQTSGENIVRGPSTVRQALMYLLVDRDWDVRGHRENILEPKFRYVGCYEIGKFGKFKTSWIQDFAN